MMRYLRHPLGQAAAVLLAAYALFEFGIAYIPPLLGIASAPVPGSVLLQYMITVLVGVLIYVSGNEERWREFRRPIGAVLVEPEKRVLRMALLVIIPILVGVVAFGQVRQTVAAPAGLRSIHPAPPSTITFRGAGMTLDGLENPLRSRGSLAEHYEVGKAVYYRNCLPCHGDALAADGHFAHGFNPAPIDLTSTLKDLTESYVFWRIAKGGRGLPREGTPWNSAMPVWEDFLTQDEIWATIIFLYEQTGLSPRTWEHAGAGGGEH
ncbi:MAG TPA: cytochrome c [Longimicrobiales bacterium]|nr:cytochrome c [Longimicrobiales bacterium]